MFLSDLDVFVIVIIISYLVDYYISIMLAMFIICFVPVNSPLSMPFNCQTSTNPLINYVNQSEEILSAVNNISTRTTWTIFKLRWPYVITCT